jgi:hypothetical protein
MEKGTWEHKELIRKYFDKFMLLKLFYSYYQRFSTFATE